MEHNNMTPEKLSAISDAEQEKEQQTAAETGYTPRPLSHRILAWICFVLMVLGILCYCYWQITPLV